MNRLPMAPIQLSLKNDYRITPPPSVFDAAAALPYQTQQRYVYPTNGAVSMPQGAYGNQIMFVSIISLCFYDRPKLLVKMWKKMKLT